MTLPGEPALIRRAGNSEMAIVGLLFREYADALGHDLSFQGFVAEQASLPGAYDAPRGALLLAFSATGLPLGCVGMRPLPEAGACEMKRLYVRPTGRGLGVGRALAVAAIKEAVTAGYRCMRLDTLPTMQAALTLYLELGFETTPPYYQTPIAGTIFLRKQFRDA